MDGIHAFSSTLKRIRSSVACTMREGAQVWVDAVPASGATASPAETVVGRAS